MPQAELARGAAGGYSFGDHRGLRKDFVKLAAAPEFYADRAIAREIAGSGQHQVPQTGKTT